ncbi:hypothetical protein ACTND3_09105, partial [Bacillota bacterium HCP28S3_F12]
KRDFHLQIGILGYRISPLIYQTGVSAYKRDSQATFHQNNIKMYKIKNVFFSLCHILCNFCIFILSHT